MKKRKLFLCILVFACMLFSMHLVSFAENNEAAHSEQEQQKEQAVRDKIYNALINMDDVIDLSEYKLSPDEAEILYLQVINDNPDLFYAVGGAIYWDYNWEGIDDDFWLTENFENLTVGEIYPEYGAPKKDIEEMRVEFQAAMDKALAGIEDSMTDFEKALYLHDYIIKLCDYDWPSYVHEGFIPTISKTAYGCLVNQVAGSSGYALAYSYLLKEVGIESLYIAGWTHAWNAINLDGHYYFVDLKCDDPIAHAYGRGCCFDCVNHAYFLLTEPELLSLDEIISHAWSQNLNIKVNDWSYSDFPFRKSSCPFNYYKGEWYYWYYWYNVNTDETVPVIAKTDDLMKVGPDLNIGTHLHSLAGFQWYTWTTGKIWKGYHGNVDISPERGKLYYCNSRQILSLDLEDLSAQPKLVCNVDTSDGYIYGLKVEDNRIVYGLAQSPYDEENLCYVNFDTIEEKDLIIGDVDGNGEINASDALIILQKAAKLQVMDCEDFVADCDADGKITALDALRILQKAAKLI